VLSITQLGTHPACTTSLSQSVATNNRITTLSYDLAGNQLSDGTYAMAWDAESRMKSYSTINYTYDGDGRRTKKSSGKLYWYGIAGEVLAESDLAGTISDEFIFFGGKRIARRASSGNVFYYLGDHLGTSRVIVQGGQSTACYEADYEPFGKERIVTDTCPQAYKFTGKERDTESGLDYFGARYLSSGSGRFTSPDRPFADQDPTVPQSMNLYTYVRNNPLGYVDAKGRWTTGIHNQIIDTVFAGASEATRQILKDASLAVDADQSPGSAHKHGMRGPADDELTASDKASDFVRGNLDRAVEQQILWEEAGLRGDSPSAVWFFGQALHTVTDVKSPEHGGYQLWRGMDWTSPINYANGNNARAATHGVIESRRGNFPGKTSESARGEAEYAARMLWAIYRRRLEEEREKRRREEEARKEEGKKKDEAK